ncbi:MAG: hypothetical protein A2033_08230 [Bacteroidetes bacterium GWA2_31_9]|nr:MAG: hypothetical protein A2033_08230 [Bacteroidetes bacterium GWA2_31_9]
MKKYKKYIYITAILLMILAFVGKRAGWFGKDTIHKVSVEQVTFRNITELITANGKIQPETEVKISADVSGEIVEMNFKEGDEVKKGDLLLKIKPDIYISALERMEASVNSAKANLANSKARQAQVEAQFIQAEQAFNRSKQLYEKNAISTSEYETAKSSYDVAKAEVEASKQTVVAADFTVVSSEASLKEANENLQKTAIYAPIGGTISKLNVELGERVVGTMQMTGTEILRIANLNVMEVMVEVNENDIVHVSLGDTAIIEVDAYLNQKFKGSVTEVANSASTNGIVATDQITSFVVKIRILPESYKHLILQEKNKAQIQKVKDEDSLEQQTTNDKQIFYPFRPGMSATVDIQTETHKNVLAVPIQAVTTRVDTLKTSVELVGEKANNTNDDEIKELVFVYQNDSVYQRQIKTSIQDNNYIEILTGLKDGESVVTAPYSLISKKLKDKMKVLKVEKDKLFEEKE